MRFAICIYIVMPHDVLPASKGGESVSCFFVVKLYRNYLQPTRFLNRYSSEESNIKRVKVGVGKRMSFIKRLISAAIESFPISEGEKAAIKRIIMGKNGAEGGKGE